ncbi:MAG TPA: hypothetical protein VK171_01460 [Fimbriimonas sp.]|nr:hypothetical protein [Fimbriimonas sp.]
MRFAINHGTVTAAWALSILSAGASLHFYEVTPSTNQIAPQTLREPSRTNTLLVFAHPKCPCTVATLKCLEELHQVHPEIQVELALVIPPNSPKLFEDGPSSEWQASHRWAKRTIDRNGTLAKSLGAIASGHTFLFEEKGDVVFAGGITRARGVVGESTALRDLITCINGKQSFGLSRHDVFGCSLL